MNPVSAAGMGRVRRALQGIALASLMVGLLGVSRCPAPAPFFFSIITPLPEQLSLAGPVGVFVLLPARWEPGSLALELDGAPVSDPIHITGTRLAQVQLASVPAGWHELRATVRARFLLWSFDFETRRRFETVVLHHPDECEILNDAECLLPFPSSRFLHPANTPTGVALSLPAVGMPTQNGAPISPLPYEGLDGFSPTVQILMHFPGGVDPALSNASRLLPARRTYDARSLDPDSPTVLIDLETGERILHFVEPDARATDPARQVLFLRPARSLTPGHHYAVAVRHLVHPDGSPVDPEPVFAALRDRRPSTIPAVEARRPAMEHLFHRLEHYGIARDDLILAFDFVVRSDADLTGAMLSMRDQAFAWLAAQVEQGRTTFQVQRVIENDCSVPGTIVWRQVEGTFEVPLFLTADPEVDPGVIGFLHVDAAGQPVPNGITHPPFTISIPCTALAGGGTPKPPLVVGHGLFGNGRSTIGGLLGATELAGFDYVAGATDWRGLSTPDIQPFSNAFILKVTLDLNQFGALPDRLRQGQLNTLVLARMLKQGLFNVDPAFQTPSGIGVIDTQEAYYFGASLGGIMGLMFAALTPDVTRLNVDVPAINFSILLQRATPFLQFELVLKATGVTDPMQTALGIGLLHELWVRGESAGYATHITDNPLPGTPPKRILMTMAWLDQQVSNQGTEIAARTLGLPNLVPGSLLTGLVDIPDRPGPLPSALVVYDTGSFDLSNPAHAPFIPPLANLQATPNHCDPHGLRGFIPASIQQLLNFLRPGGMIENFCNGTCDAAEPLELPHGASAPCDPLS